MGANPAVSDDVIDDWRPSASIATLKHRAAVIRQVREWFFQHSVLEVETPQLVSGATTDPHIDSFETSGRKKRTLRTSSEFHQKRLLAAGSGDIYEIGKVFRVDESGRYHNPEFTMLEWYRCGINHHTLIDEVQQLLEYLHAQQSSDDKAPVFEKISYRELWLQQAGIDVADRDCKSLAAFIESTGCPVPEMPEDDFDSLLDLGMAAVLADRHSKNTYTCIYNYPASQASLAKIDQSDPEYAFACRFEIYFGAVELANGYYELTDGTEQSDRFESDNRQRSLIGKQVMPVDHHLVNALHTGLPECSGVAIGFDRLLMVLSDIASIEKTLSFDWTRA